MSDIPARSSHWRKSGRLRAGRLPRGSIEDHSCYICGDEIGGICVQGIGGRWMVCRETMVVGELVVDARSYGAVAARVCFR